MEIIRHQMFPFPDFMHPFSFSNIMIYRVKVIMLWVNQMNEWVLDQSMRVIIFFIFVFAQPFFFLRISENFYLIISVRIRNFSFLSKSFFLSILRNLSYSFILKNYFTIFLYTLKLTNFKQSLAFYIFYTFAITYFYQHLI